MNNEQVIKNVYINGQIVPDFDAREIVYSNPGQGKIDYVSYTRNAVEVFRETFTYDAQGNITNIVT